MERLREYKTPIFNFVGGVSIGFCIGFSMHEYLHNHKEWNKIRGGIKRKVISNGTSQKSYTTANVVKEENYHSKKGSKTNEKLEDTSTKYRKVSDNSSTTKSKTDCSTLNQEEVDKFRRMAHDWWDPKGPAQGLLSMNQLRVPFIKDGLVNSGRCSKGGEGVIEPLSKLRILDVGCGAGLLSEPLARLGAEVTGIDPVKENVECAQEHSSEDPLVAERVTYVCSTIEEFVRDNPEMKKFDAVVASEVIEHVDNPPHFVSSCASILDEGGSFFLTTINRTTISYVGAIICAEYILRLLPTGTHDWKKFIAPQELENMLKDSGFPFRVRLVHGMFYFPFFDKWTWIPYTGVNYALHAVKIDS